MNMDWMKFVKGEETVLRSKSQNFYLDKIMAEVLENNTLANWVTTTNQKLGLGHY